MFLVRVSLFGADTMPAAQPEQAMPTIQHGDARLYYEEYGHGFPLLLFAPGGMRSALSFWARSPWNPIEALAGQFRVIAMDQRRAFDRTDRRRGWLAQLHGRSHRFDE